VSRYKYTKLKNLSPVHGFMIHTPDGRTLKDIYPQFIVRELNRLNDRIKLMEEDSERLHWLLNRGLAWRDCYDDHWINGEWLYASQDAIETIDKAREAKP